MFTFEYVEPYSNGSCQLYTNCLQCLSDSLCGWCEPSRRCLSRIVQKSDQSDVGKFSDCYLDQGNSTTAFLTLNPSQCINCSNHISCQQCVADGSCEWLVDEAYCTRRGRYFFQVSTSAKLWFSTLTHPVFFLFQSGLLVQFNRLANVPCPVTKGKDVLLV